MLGFALETGPALGVAELNDVILGAGMAGQAELRLAAVRVAEVPGEAPGQEEVKGSDRLFAQDDVPHSITLGTNTSQLLLSRSEDRSRLEAPVEKERHALSAEDLKNSLVSLMEQVQDFKGQLSSLYECGEDTG